MVDIDQGEIDKFKTLGRKVFSLRMDVKDFIEKTWVRSKSLSIDWVALTQEWKRKYPAYDPSYKIGEGINPYEFVYNLSDYLKKDDIIVSDTGCPVGWMATTYRFKGERFYHGWNNTPMGYGLPASIGASFASGSRVVLVTGDGGLAVNITELATLQRHNLNVKIILFNNRGHAMCRQTQRTWLGGEYPSTSYEGGLACPDYKAVARAYGIRLAGSIQELVSNDGPGFLNLDIHEDYQISPQVKFGKALEDADPPISREELAEVMK
jgi:acetolactate synthase-1/2/3 large subunit